MKLSFEQICEAIRGALRALLGPGYDSPGWSIVATFEDSVIISKGPTALVRYPVTFDSKGTCTLGTAEAVEVHYQALKEGHGARLLGPILEEGQKPGSKWAVVVIQEGLSQNRTLYPGAVLQRAAKLYEGAKVFWNHSQSGMRDPRDIAGFLRGAKCALLEGDGAGVTAILATLHATDPAAREKLMEASEAGEPGLFGLSHTAHAETERVRHTDGLPAFRVKEIKAVESVDIVSFPSAGGRVMRLVAGQSSPVEALAEDLAMFEKKLARLKESRPDLFAKLGPTPTEAEVDALLLEAVTSVKPPEPAPTPAPTPDKGGLSDADRSILREARVDRIIAKREFGDLKDETRSFLLEMAETGATEKKLEEWAEVFAKKAAKLVEGITGSGAGKTDVQVGKDEADKLVHALDGFFAGSDVEKVGRFRSIREGYVAITGDVGVTGRITEAKGLARYARLMEGLSSGSWANVLGNSITRQMVKEYNAEGGAYADNGRGWLWDGVPVSDFRSQERTRFGGYGNFAIVTEGNPYPTVTSPTDEKATYSAAKRGGIESVTWEMILNDDVGSVRRIPTKMAFAARRTFYEFVYSLIIANPTIYDSVALFHATHANTTTSALAAATYMAARVAMLKQAEKDSSKRLGLILRHLMVPVDLEETARNLFKRNTNNDPQFVQDAAPTIHVITHTTDATDWFACAGVDQTPQIEIGFLAGREEPELFVADMPNSGSLFYNDKIDYKLRHPYGGNVLDYRGFYGGIVA